MPTGDPGLYANTKLIDKKGYLTDLITDHALDFIKRNHDKPWFAEVAFNAPHWPFQSPGNPKDERTEETYGRDTGTRAEYVRMVEHLDQSVGKLLDAVERSGQSKNTLVLFLSDNGGERLSNNGPLFHGKYTLWEGGIRVPCLVRWPDKIPARTVSAQPVITMDLTASILAAAGIKPPADPARDGENLLPILMGQKRLQERTFFWRLPRPDEKFGQKAVRKGKWKYVYDREVELLFDLSADIGERRNLAYQHPEIVEELRKALADWESKLPKLKE